MKTSSIDNARHFARRNAGTATVALFLLTWPLPVLYYAMTNSAAPWLPAILQRRTNVSRLFSSERPVWAIYAVEYRLATRKQYEVLEEEEFFRMQPFGKRTRLQRILATSDSNQIESLCLWLKERLQVSRAEPVTSVRILSFPSRPHAGKLHGGYTQPSLADADPAEVRIISQCDFPAE